MDMRSLMNIEMDGEDGFDAPISAAVDDLPSISKKLEMLAEKMRSHTENKDDDFSYGVEDGMQRAAEMIDNMIKQLGEVPDDF